MKPCRVHLSVFCLTAALGVLAGPLVPAAHAQPTRPVPEDSPTIFDAALDPSYPVLDNVEGDWVNLHPIPVRPMALTADGARAYAVNPYHNTVREFDATFQPTATYRTLWGPVSVALYVHPEDGLDSDRLLVVCQHSDALMVLNRLTGKVIDIVRLPPQPADIVVLQEENTAFVSTTKTDVVVEIDLVTSTVVGRYAVPSRRPTFLSVTPDGEVLVAARWSGNNSAVHRHATPDTNTQANALGVLDLANPAVATPPGLPDEDVFWLDRATQTAVPVARGMGTLLFAQETSPIDGKLWQLNTEANNKDPNKQTEAAIQGFISANRLTRVTLASPLGSAVVQPTASDISDLDLLNPTGTYNPPQSVGTPYSITFSSYGYAFITGLLTDNVVVLDTSGSWVLEWDLPNGCIPRQVLLDPTDTFALVYCTGLNTVPVYYLSVPPSLVGTFDLGFDPTPASAREGRKIFFDASHSLNNNHSCATCHDELGMDLLAWNLSNGEIDNKGPMTTQTLKSINRAVPFHWRGEQLQHLLDFNGAFQSLLGGTPLSDADFGKFEDFVLSVQERANPFQNASRILDDSIQPPILDPNQNPNSSAIAGKQIYLSTCEGCHHLPTGSSNDMIGDGAVFSEPIPKRQWIKVPHLLSVHAKGQQPDQSVNLVGIGLQRYPTLGTGLAHSGNPRNIFHFLSFFFGTSDPRTSDGANFLFQFDTGVAPAVHAHQLLNLGKLAAAQTFLNTYLIPQANRRNCDIGVFGETTVGTTTRVFGWYYDRSTGLFVRDDNVSQPLSFFVNRAQLNGEWFVFSGLGVGMGKTWAIDFDGDDFPNGLEQLTPTDGRYIVDTDGDGDWDGHEWLNGGNPFNAAVQSNDTTPPGILGAPVSAQWSTSKVARLTFETDELTTSSLTLNPPPGLGLSALSYSDSRPVRTHDLLVDALFPSLPGTSNTYTGTLAVTDQAGITSSQPISISSRVFTDLSTTTVVGNLAWGPIAISFGSVSFNATVRVDQKFSGPLQTPAPGQIVVARALVNGVPATTNLLLPAGAASAFCVNSVPYTPVFHTNPVLGPFIISGATNASGSATLQFTLTGLVIGDVVTLSIEAISPLHSTTPVCPGTTVDPNLQPAGGGGVIFPKDWSFPDTKKPFRALTYTR